MKYRYFFIICSLSLFLHSALGANPFIEPHVMNDVVDRDAMHPKPSQNFAKFLRDAHYAPTFIKYLRKHYPDKHEEIDAILLPRYIYEYRMAIADAASIEEQQYILTGIEGSLIAEPHWIDHGWEPYLVGTNDGSDRGGSGLRMKALKIVRDEVKKATEK